MTGPHTDLVQVDHDGQVVAIRFERIEEMKSVPMGDEIGWDDEGDNND